MADGPANPGRQKAVAAVDTTFRAVESCAAEELWLPCLVLTYAMIDAMAWLARDPQHEDVTRADFVNWAELYLLQPPTHACSALDLYGARCGLLHSHTVESKLMREGVARPLYYELPDGEVLAPIFSSSARLYTQVALRPFLQRVREACAAFFAAADADALLGAMVWTRASTYYDHVVPWPKPDPEVL